MAFHGSLYLGIRFKSRDRADAYLIRIISSPETYSIRATQYYATDCPISDNVAITVSDLINITIKYGIYKFRLD